MHIAEGVLSAPILLTGAGATVLGTTVGLKQIENDDIPQVAIVSSALFVGSLIHIPIGPTSIHLILNALAGILLGWKAFPAFLVAFLLQSILFQFGGLTALGVNVFIVALPAVICHYLFTFLVKQKKSSKALAVSGFICGGLTILSTVVLLMLALFFTHQSFYQMAKMILIANLPLVIIEATLTTFCLLFLEKVKPELFVDFNGKDLVRSREL